MPHEKAREKTLLDILKTQSYAKLKPYTDPSIWQKLSHSEKKLLAKLFVLRGEKELQSSKKKTALAKAKTSFTLATQILPLDYMLWYKRGYALSQSLDKALIEEASLCFEKAVKLCPSFIDGWCAWGALMMHRALILDDPQYLTVADEKFAMAQTLIEKDESQDYTHSEFYWQYGFLSFMIARHSEEAVDFNKAIQFYRKAQSLGCQSREFYNDFGNALVEFSLLINQPQMLFEAIDYYQLSVDDVDVNTILPEELASRFFNLGSCYQCLFEIHHDEVFFKNAIECFISATKLNSEFFRAYIHWAGLLLYAAKLWQNVVCLKDAVAMFSRACQISPQEPLLLAQLSEALSLFGTQEENLKMLNDACALAHAALEIDATLVDAVYSHALSLYSLGRYFQDESYYIQALQKLENEKVLHKNVSSVWHLIANCKSAYAELTDDMAFLQEALVAFEKAAKGESGRFGYFYNDWGMALLHVAELTQDMQLAQEVIDKFEYAVVLHDLIHPYWLVNLGSAFIFFADLADDEAAYEKAIQVLTNALEVDPDSSTAYFHMGIAYSHLAEIQTDAALFDKAIYYMSEGLQRDLEDENGHCEIGLAYIHKAQLLVDTERKQLLEHAEYHFLQALHLGNIAVFYNLACLYALQNNTKKSIYFLEKAVDHEAHPLVEGIIEDDWLESIKGHASFKAILQRIMKDAACDDDY